jgi:hypothetical protein
MVSKQITRSRKEPEMKITPETLASMTEQQVQDFAAKLRDAGRGDLASKLAELRQKVLQMNTYRVTSAIDNVQAM